MDIPKKGKIARAQHVKHKKSGHNNHQLGALKCGVEVLHNVQHMMDIDKANGNETWTEAKSKEISGLLALNCFKFHSLTHKPPLDHQCAP